MPVNSPDVPPKVRRIGLLIPLVAAIVLFGGIALIAVTHLSAKGPGPAFSASSQQVATGQVPTRGPYGPSDLTEPKNQ